MKKKVDILETAQKAFDNIDWDDARKWFEDKRKIEDHQEKRMGNFLKNLSKKGLDGWVIKFFKWEKEYRDFFYSKHIDTESNIFATLIRAIEKDGKQIKNLREDFLGYVFTWKNFTFKLYVGQGSFWKIFKGKKQIW